MDTDKKKIWCNGQSIEVSDEVYEAYKQGDRKIRYFEKDLKTERVWLNPDGTIKQIIPSREDSLERLIDDNAQQFSDDTEPIEETILRNLAKEKLHKVIMQLSEEERFLITALFFEEKSEREIADLLKISQPAIHKRKDRILDKLKKLVSNI